MALLAALLLTTACSAGTAPQSGNHDRWQLVIDGQPTDLGRAGTTDLSYCEREDDGHLAMVWTGDGVDGSPEGAVTVFLNRDDTVYSVGVRLNTGENSWETFSYGPDSAPGTAASVVRHDADYYRISGMLAGGAQWADTPVALQPPLHAFDLHITCVTNV